MRLVPVTPPLRCAEVEIDPRAIVLHSTETDTAEEAIAILRDRGLSYNYLVDRDGTVFELVTPPKGAFHAGVSMGPCGEAANGYSVGISFVNLNDGQDPILVDQEVAIRELILDLKSRLPNLQWLTTHAAIAPNRKVDPKGYDPAPLARDTGLDLWLG